MTSRDEMIKRFKGLTHYSMLERERGRNTCNEDRQQYHEDLILALDLAIKYLNESE